MNDQFYKLLYKEISNTTDNNNTIVNESNINDDQLIRYNSKCLISYLPLEKDHVRLLCGHCFNYKEIYNEVYIQKYNKSNSEIQKLKKNQIKCPYCRKIQNYLLPYNKEFILIDYVNYPHRLCMKNKYCKYIFVSGKKKGVKCNKNCKDDYCTQHNKLLKNKKVYKQCSHILLTGKNKGNNCSNKIFSNDLCKKHYNKLNN
jgi:hypothetical protein